MKRLALVGALALAGAGCNWLTGEFSLTGTVDIAPELRERVPKENAMLFVVAKNAGGVPVAVHRIVNPIFPAPFALDAADLLVPMVRRREDLKLSIEMNTHGQVGSPRPGDFAGELAETVHPGAFGLRLVVARVR